MTCVTEMSFSGIDNFEKQMKDADFLFVSNLSVTGRGKTLRTRLREGMSERKG